MGHDNRLSEAESILMNWFWEKGEMSTAELGALVADRQWKPTTLLTFLSRLVGKGMLAVEKRGKTNLYRPVITREDYQSRAAGSFLDEVYGGSATAFLASMVNARGISKKELAQLRQWLAEKEAEADE